MAYCIAFSHDNAVDVTRRYILKPRQYRLPRTKCPEEVLLHILNEIREQKRRNLSPEERKRLEREDRHEEREFRQYEMRAMIKDGLLEPSDAEKRPRESGWLPRRLCQCFCTY